MKIALAQLNCHIGNFTGNTTLIKNKINEARTLGAELVVFPELALSGYPPLDFLEFNHFTKKCSEAIDEIANSCTDIDVIIGSPSKNPVKEGKNLFIPHRKKTYRSPKNPTSYNLPISNLTTTRSQGNKLQPGKQC